jgi:hypothetical protein
MRLALWIVFAVCCAPAMAHDRWANNEPVPSWVKTMCCGPEDVHHLTHDQVELRPDGYHIQGYHDVVPVSQALPSQDGDYWAFYRELGDGTTTSMYCFFTPFSGT